MITFDWTATDRVLYHLLSRSSALGSEREGGKGLAGMVLLTDGTTLEATEVESAPITAVLRREKRRPAVDDLSSEVLVKEAQELVSQVVSILDDPAHEQRSSLSFRLARAHALTLLDHLETMADSR
jgi:hypothetical protein